jgi:hypothetical protein
LRLAQETERQTPMTMNAGVWIDHDKAMVVLLTDEGQEMLQIRPATGATARSPAGLRAKNSYTSDDSSAEGHRDRKGTSHLNEYYDEVIACLRDAQAILILGPEQAKGEFRRRMAWQKVSGHVAEIKTVARLSDEQIGDYVRQHFQ